MFHSTQTSNARQNYHLQRAVVRKMLWYESQIAELFSSDKCWKVFLCLWKLNVKMTTLLQIRKQWIFFFRTRGKAPDYWLTVCELHILNQVSQVWSPQETVNPRLLFLYLCNKSKFLLKFINWAFVYACWDVFMTCYHGLWIDFMCLGVMKLCKYVNMGHDLYHLTIKLHGDVCYAE